MKAIANEWTWWLYRVNLYNCALAKFWGNLPIKNSSSVNFKGHVFLGIHHQRDRDEHYGASLNSSDGEVKALAHQKVPNTGVLHSSQISMLLTIAIEGAKSFMRNRFNDSLIHEIISTFHNYNPHQQRDIRELIEIRSSAIRKNFVWIKGHQMCSL